MRIIFIGKKTFFYNFITIQLLAHVIIVKTHTNMTWLYDRNSKEQSIVTYYLSRRAKSYQKRNVMKSTMNHFLLRYGLVGINNSWLDKLICLTVALVVVHFHFEINAHAWLIKNCVLSLFSPLFIRDRFHTHYMKKRFTFFFNISILILLFEAEIK